MDFWHRPVGNLKRAVVIPCAADEGFWANPTMPDAGVGLRLRSGCGAGGCPNCCPSNRWYVSGEYLYWWLKGDRTPPLVTTGVPTGVVSDAPAGPVPSDTVTGPL